MVDAYVALGSNLGARHRALEDANLACLHAT